MIKVGVIGYTGRVNSLIVNRLVSGCENITLSGVLVRGKVLDKELSFNTYDKIDQLAEVSDAIIDFTSPSTSIETARALSKYKVFLVSGSTGFTDSEFNEFRSYSKYYPMLWSANMSIGINLILRMVKEITPILRNNFDASIVETHHRHKKDSPSGTAKVIAQAIKEGGIDDIQISPIRIGESKGEHIVSFVSKDEQLTISHNVFSRDTFVEGALMACRWGVNKKPGFYSMQDVFGGF